MQTIGDSAHSITKAAKSLGCVSFMSSPAQLLPESPVLPGLGEPLWHRQGSVLDPHTNYREGQLRGAASFPPSQTHQAINDSCRRRAARSFPWRCTLGTQTPFSHWVLPPAPFFIFPSLFSLPNLPPRNRRVLRRTLSMAHSLWKWYSLIKSVSSLQFLRIPTGIKIHFLCPVDKKTNLPQSTKLHFPSSVPSSKQLPCTLRRRWKPLLPLNGGI